jgi:hypothetical protein
MKISMKILFAVMSLMLASAVLWSFTLVAQDELDSVVENEAAKPTMIPYEVRATADQPSDEREVAVLQLVIEAEEGDELLPARVTEVQLSRAYIVQGFAPNVEGREGAWTVAVTGEVGEFRFGIENLAVLHVYPSTEELQENPELGSHERVVQSGIVVDLIIPLYQLEENINAQTIAILDESGTVIFETTIDREVWLRTGNELSNGETKQE